MLGSRRTGPASTRSRDGFETGDYLCSEQDLFRVEEVVGDHVLIENCRDGELIDVSCADLRRLRRVDHRSRVGAGS